MSNSAFFEIIEQTSLLLEYNEGRSFVSDELASIAERVKYLEVPLDLFSRADLGNESEVRALDEMLGFWFGGFSRDGIWILRETVLTRTNPIRDDLLRSTSPSVVELLKIKSLPVELINFIRGPLHIRNVEQLQKACEASVLSKTAEFSEQDELDILADIVERRQSREREKTNLEELEPEVSHTTQAKEPESSDPDAIFHANADALADAIIESLRAPLKVSLMQSASDFVSKDTLSAATDQARGALGRAMRFFISPNNPKYQQLRKDEEERSRAQAERRARAELEQRHKAEVSRPLEAVKVGPVRRGCEAVSQLDFLIRTDNPEVAFERVKKADFVSSVTKCEGNWLSATLRPAFFDMPYNNRPTPPVTLNFYTASDFVWGTKEVVLTSSKEHWDELQRRARERGMSLTGLGLYKGVKRVSSRTSKRLYEMLGADEIPVELRQGNVGWNWLEEGKPDLIRPEDMQADLHMHTTYSDGLGNVEDMLEMAFKLGLSYIALSDHSKSAPGVSGLTDSEFKNYWEIIDRLNERLRIQGSGFRILKSAEVDILPEGGLDIQDETLAGADWVIASLHLATNQPQDVLHRRYLDALKNPYVDVIAHPTERVIGRDAPMPVDFEFLCENAKKFGKYIELNSQPRRLDAGFSGLLTAKRHGVKIVISTDAHAPEHMEFLRFGVEQARRAGYTKRDVVNTLSCDDFIALRKQRKIEALARG